MSYTYYRIKDYASALKCMLGAKDQDAGRPIDNHTRLLWGDGRTLCIRFHKTDIITYHENGDIDVTNGGWPTRTTRARIEGFSDVRIGTYAGFWTLHWRGRSWVYSNCRLFADQRRTPLIYSHRDILRHRSEKLTPLAKAQADLEGRREVLRELQQTARLIVRYDLVSELGKAVGALAVSRLQYLEQEFLDSLDRHVAAGVAEVLRQQRALDAATRVDGKELRTIVLHGGKV
jgi:hypothetical protein